MAESLVVDLDLYKTYLKKSKSARKFLAGLAAIGLAVSEAGGTAVIISSQNPAMMSALKSLAIACAQYPDERAARFIFARCDFKALKKGYTVDPLDLYRIYNPPDFERAVQLHEFLSGLNYKTEM